MAAKNDGNGPEDGPQTGSQREGALPHLLAVMATLRRRCPWDREQSFESIAPYTVEEAYEVADAIARRDWPGLKEELGDLLFQVVFHAHLAAEAGLFAFDDVARAAGDKMVARHPHVFDRFAGSAGSDAMASARSQSEAWEADKARQRRDAARREGRLPSALDGVAAGLAPLTRAAKLQKRAAATGFDWPDAAGVVADAGREFDELKREIASGGGRVRLEDELGDLLFSAVNLTRHLGLDPETALARTNRKFEARFRHIEARLAERGRSADDASRSEMERLWNEAKLSRPRPRPPIPPSS